MRRVVKFIALVTAVVVGSVALPTLLPKATPETSPYLSALQEAALPTAAAVPCNQWVCVTIGQDKGCYEEFEYQHWCTTTIGPQGQPWCEGTFDCEL